MTIKTELQKLSLSQLQDVAKPEQKPEPEFDKITKAKGLAVLNRLREVEANGGYHKIAQAENVPVVWVMKLDRLRQEVIAEKLSAVSALEVE
ncbi:MAG: hypothetical protein GY832_23735 [Chloroflexi bacterium]|nr:hypothetical protein [Chloroflexota bacterium]